MHLLCGDAKFRAESEHAPSVKRVEALTITTAESMRAVNSSMAE